MKNHIFRLTIAAITAILLAACVSDSTPAAESQATTPPSVEPGNPTTAEPTDSAAAPTEAATGDQSGQPAKLSTQGEDVIVTSGGKDYTGYLAAPDQGGPYPGIVLIHSIRGLEEGYRTMTDHFAAEGFVVLAIGWQTFERQPPDDVVEQLTRDSITFLTARGDVDTSRLGLTGFCAGGRYTMLLLPKIKEFNAGVAWYGFPYSGSTQPASLIGDLDAPMLIIHGTADEASPIADINRYADELKAAGKSYELKVYEGEPHGFMLVDGQLRADDVANDAFGQMIRYFKENLG